MTLRDWIKTLTHFTDRNNEEYYWDLLYVNVPKRVVRTDSRNGPKSVAIPDTVVIDHAERFLIVEMDDCEDWLYAEPSRTSVQTAQQRRPVHTVVIKNLVGSIWPNFDGNKQLWYSVTLSRTYQSDGKTQTSHSFGRDDLLVCAEIMRLCFLWITKKQGAQGLSEDVNEHAFHER